MTENRKHSGEPGEKRLDADSKRDDAAPEAQAPAVDALEVVQQSAEQASPKGREAEVKAPDAFAPANPTDNRELYDFKSRWHTDARKAQRTEGIYLAVLAIFGIVGFTLLHHPPFVEEFQIGKSIPLVFFSGLLGGITFDVKWWYHSIAKGIWNQDRRAWRLAVPWQAAVVAMFVHLLFKSDLLGILNPTALDKPNNVLAFGFLVGYFSDSAIAKLAEIAESLFGTARGGRNNRRD
ncbi:MAG: hypothetical protein IPM54_20175 [Polyangiaceae bacterium]|nr:hypothetical protein [Polyangiaceae bacterium]